MTVALTELLRSRRGTARVVDALVIVALTVVLELLVWDGQGPGDPITGPRPVMAMLPLLMTLPLWWRRRFPLLVCTLVMAGPATEGLISGQVAENIAGVVAAGMVAYAVALYSSRSRAFVGLAVVLGGYGVRLGYDHNVRTGRSNELWAASFFGLYLLAAWLIGAVQQARRESARQAEHAAATQREAEQAVAEERARIARDLHDIVSHNLSVVVVQAAGGRAQLDRNRVDAGATLEKIESSGREALAEMRRLLGVLRPGEDEGPPLSPTPGLGELATLIDAMRDVGLDASLTVEIDSVPVPPAVDVSVYRIVQEALTNVLKHAGPGSRAEVSVCADDRQLVVEVIDDGPGPGPEPGHGHGLRGMQERVNLLCGELSAGMQPGGGFRLLARLPLDGPT